LTILFLNHVSLDLKQQLLKLPLLVLYGILLKLLLQSPLLHAAHVRRTARRLLRILGVSKLSQLTVSDLKVVTVERRDFGFYLHQWMPFNRFFLSVE